jgi:SanA protein
MAAIESKRVALVLGTSKRTAAGTENEYFSRRMKAASELYHAGKVTNILVSGDNRTEYYNEPQDMYNALKELGIPDSSITLDFAGFRTLDSVVRCIKIFGQSRFIIVSQEFHGYRALYIADQYGAEAQVYTAEDPIINNVRVSIREIIARSLAFIDLHIINKQPKFLGEKEEI